MEKQAENLRDARQRGVDLLPEVVQLFAGDRRTRRPHENGLKIFGTILMKSFVKDIDKCGALPKRFVFCFGFQNLRRHTCLAEQ